MTESRVPNKPGIVDWYSPRELLRTAIKVVASTILGEMVDMRRMGALEGAVADRVTPEREGSDTFSFDYMADTGDGWHATHTMAHLVSAAAVTAMGAEGIVTLPRADFLILGGDQVYPDASRKAYASRLVWPFNEAWRQLGRPQRTSAYLIPGNHDWYDSLAAMTYRFFQGRDFGAFTTRQAGSYFAVVLPGKWEIWGIDLQLQHGLDVKQQRFFQDRAKSLAPDHRVVFCTAEPTFVYGSEPDEELGFQLRRVEKWVQDAGARVPLVLAGDIHNYQHYVRQPEQAGQPVVHEVVCGGGGAFLHPTHVERRAKAGRVRRVRTKGATYPPRARSFRRSLGLLAFPFRHVGFASLLGLAYLFLLVGVDLGRVGVDFPLAHPLNALAGALLLIGTAAFTRKEAPWGWVVGLMHGAAHLLAAAAIWRVVPPLIASLIPADALGLGWSLVSTYMPLLGVFVTGGLVGGFLFGAFLFIALNAFQVHHNEAFSALACPDDKSFLRCKLQPDGRLEVSVIGVPRVAREGDQHPVSTELVERFIVD